MGQSSTWPHYQYTHCRWHEQRSIQSHVVTSITLHKQPRARIQLLNQALGRSCKRGRMDESRKRKYIFVFCTGNLWEGIWGEQEVRGAILKVKEICSALFHFQRQSQQDCTGISKWLQIPALTAPAAAPVSGISISPAAEGPSQTWPKLSFKRRLYPSQPRPLLLLIPWGRVAASPLFLYFLHTLTASKPDVDKAGPHTSSSNAHSCSHCNRSMQYLRLY